MRKEVFRRDATKSVHRRGHGGSSRSERFAELVTFGAVLGATACTQLSDYDCTSTRTCSPDAASDSRMDGSTMEASGGRGGTSGAGSTGNGASTSVMRGNGAMPSTDKGGRDGEERGGAATVIADAGAHLDAAPPDAGADVGHDGKSVCESTRADCDMDRSNGCEVDLGSDAHSCGACAHDCRGGACKDGQCQPNTLAAGLVNPVLFAVDGVYAHWIENDYPNPARMMRVRLSDDVTALIGQTVVPGAMASDGTYLYWTIPSRALANESADGAIMRMKEGTAAPEGVQSGMDPHALALDGKNIYWSDWSMNGVFQSGREPNDKWMKLTSEGHSLSLASDGTVLCGTGNNGESVFCVPVGGGAVTQVPSLNGKALNADSVWLGSDAEHAYAWFYDSVPALHLMELAKPTLTSPRDIATGTPIDFLKPFTVGGGYAYYLLDDGIHRAPTTANGSSSLVVAATSTITQMAYVNGALYWLESGPDKDAGALKRLAVF